MPPPPPAPSRNKCVSFLCRWVLTCDRRSSLWKQKDSFAMMWKTCWAILQFFWFGQRGFVLFGVVCCLVVLWKPAYQTADCLLLSLTYAVNRHSNFIWHTFVNVINSKLVFSLELKKRSKSEVNTADAAHSVCIWSFIHIRVIKFSTTLWWHLAASVQ